MEHNQSPEPDFEPPITEIDTTTAYESGQVALKGAGTLEDVLGVDEAIRWHDARKRNMEKSLRLARIMYPRSRRIV